VRFEVLLGLEHSGEPSSSGCRAPGRRPDETVRDRARGADLGRSQIWAFPSGICWSAL